jgi:hypothetical protein
LFEIFLPGCFPLNGSRDEEKELFEVDKLLLELGTLTVLLEISWGKTSFVQWTNLVGNGTDFCRAVGLCRNASLRTSTFGFQGLYIGRYLRAAVYACRRRCKRWRQADDFGADVKTSLRYGGIELRNFEEAR